MKWSNLYSEKMINYVNRWKFDYVVGDRLAQFAHWGYIQNSWIMQTTKSLLMVICFAKVLNLAHIILFRWKCFDENSVSRTG